MKHSSPDKSKTTQQVPNGNQNAHGAKEIPKSDKDNIVSQDQTQHPYNFWHTTRYERINLIILGGILFVTTIYAIFAGLQWNIMCSSMELDQRAWIGAPIISGNWEVGKPIIVTVVFKNTGKTPAKNVSDGRLCEIIENDARPNFAEEQFLESQTVASEKIRALVTPQQEITLITPIYPGLQGVLGDDIKEVLDNKKRFYIHGIIRYEDMFRHAHWITFCYFYNASDRSYKIYKEHNDTGDN